MKEGERDISVVIPCFNEESSIRMCLESVLDEFTLKKCEIIVVDGMSTDCTRDILKEYEEKYDNFVVLTNPERLQAYGMNMGIRNSKGDRIVRIDAHSIYPKAYVTRCIKLLEESMADNVGGVMIPMGSTLFGQAVAIAMRHSLGIRSAGGRGDTYKGYVDSVYLGAFRRSIFEKVGYFDPMANPNEDGEMNLRIRNAGGKIFLDSSLEVQYMPRESLKGLAQQYFRYGLGRGYTTLKHGKITAYRQITPVPLVIIIISSFAIAPFFVYSLVVPAAYCLGIIGVSLSTKSATSLRMKFLLGVALATIHLSYGIGFVARIVKGKGILR